MSRPSASIDPNHFRLGEIFDSDVTVLAPEPGVPISAPGQPHVRRAEGIYPHRAGLHTLHHPMHTSDVSAPDPRSEAVGRAVRESNGILLIREANDGGNWTEDLFLRDAHRVLDFGEHGGNHEEARVPEARAAGGETRAFALADLDVVEHPLHLHCRDQ